MKALVTTCLAGAILALAGPAVAGQGDDLYDQRDRMETNMSQKAPAAPSKVTVRGWHRYSKKPATGRKHTTGFRFTSGSLPKARTFPALSHNRIYSHSVTPRRAGTRRGRTR